MTGDWLDNESVLVITASGFVNLLEIMFRYEPFGLTSSKYYFSFDCIDMIARKKNQAAHP